MTLKSLNVVLETVYPRCKNLCLIKKATMRRHEQNADKLVVSYAVFNHVIVKVSQASLL